ncbi:hypothetical protein [Microbacterium gallinarum]|uniref:Uncharacterized protein n=1 Tax=Microbacterium gallinarum TaxID=2762209 RepID=A0ABR8X6C2_9MICO|nr:hypothetical protein [Microbacterium gallinarum]MBD8024870.1 hypothetical protein [Microbacterium gallinarum]
MPPVQYGNLYRFVASLGIIALVASVTVPWLFINSLVVLTISQEQLEALTPTARQVIELRQSGVALAQVFVVALALMLFLIGVAALWWSISRWAARQRVEDEKDDFELLKARGEFEEAPTAEVTARTDEEAAELAGTVTVTSSVEGHIEPSRPLPPTSTSPTNAQEGRFSSALAVYAEVERRLADLLRRAFDGAFDVLTNVRQKGRSGSTILDFLVDPRTEGLWGPFGIELKVVSRNSSVVRVLREGMSSLAEATGKFAIRSVYTGPTSHRFPPAKCSGVLFLIVDADRGEAERIQGKAQEVAAGVNATLVRPVGVVVISRSSFDTASAERLRAMFAEALQGSVVASV